MTKRRENRSGRNQVVWDQAPLWGKKTKNRRGRKKKVGERRERRGRSGEGKGWRFFSLLRSPLGSLYSPIYFLFDPVFHLLPARNEEGEGRVSCLSLSQPWLPRFFFLLTFLWAFPWVKLSKQYPCKAILANMLPAFQVGSKNINTKSTKLTFFLFNLLESFSWARRFT